MTCHPDGRVSRRGTLTEVVEQLSIPRVIWLMLPSGDPTGKTIKAETAITETRCARREMLENVADCKDRTQVTGASVLMKRRECYISFC